MIGDWFRKKRIPTEKEEHQETQRRVHQIEEELRELREKLPGSDEPPG